MMIWTCILHCREFLWKFFYPADYQPMKATELPQPGQCRMWKSFDFKMSMQHDVTLDILFTKDKVTLSCSCEIMCFVFILQHVTICCRVLTCLVQLCDKYVIL